MYKIKFSNDANHDIHEIGEYYKTEYGSEQLGNKIVEKIARRIRQLELFPESGAPLESIIPLTTDYRYLLCENYLIFYTFSEKVVRIERIIYARKNYLSSLFKQ